MLRRGRTLLLDEIGRPAMACWTTLPRETGGDYRVFGVDAKNFIPRRRLRAAFPSLTIPARNA